MTTYKVGDRIISGNRAELDDLYRNQVGTIVEPCGDGFRIALDDVPCPYGPGWIFSVEDFSLLVEEVSDDEVAELFGLKPKVEVTNESLAAWLLDKGYAEPDAGYGHVDAETLAEALMSEFNITKE
jgi:hypothetical protein